jgi:hypothetical protein
MQPYPGSKQASSQRTATPTTVKTAAKLMYLGAAANAVGIIVALATTGSLRSAIHEAHPALTSSKVVAAERATVAIVIVIGVVAIGLWLWMAAANKAGRSWARVTSSVFFGLSTLVALGGLTRPEPVLSNVVIGIIWLVGLAATILLWRGESSAYYRSIQSA